VAKIAGFALANGATSSALDPAVEQNRQSKQQRLPNGAPMTKPNPFLWPKKVRISTDRRLDLADTLMLGWNPLSRTVYLGMAIDTTEEPAVWDAALIARIERQIRYDLNFDAYHVTIKRLTVEPDLWCPLEFRWKLRIQPAS
jgi:hypothetical protein